MIPLLSWFMFEKAGKSVVEIVPILQSHTKFQFGNLFQFDKKLLNLFLLILSCTISYISPHIMQRVYMASSPTQAQKVFSYALLFKIIIGSFIILAGLSIFVGAPDLPKEAVWEYVLTHIPPIFKGFLATSLVAMAMSTADSCVNSCSVMVSHDIVRSIQKKEKQITDAFQLRIARCTTIAVGLSAMLLAFYCQDLLKLMYWSLYLYLPISAAPFILAIYNFRGTSRTALIGMGAGVLTILTWNEWVQPSTGIDGSSLAMVANGLAMMAAHYWLKQPESAGWVGPDYQFKQIQQENTRKRAEQKEAIKNAWANKAATFAKVRPSDATLCLMGLYIIATATLGYWFLKQGCLHKAICQVVVGFLFASYGLFTRYKTFFSKAIPDWSIGLCWLIGLSLYFPIDLLWNWWHMVDPIFTAFLSLAHCAVILWVLPLYLGIRVVAATLLLSIYPIGLLYSVLCSLFPLFLLGLLLFAITICLKVKLGHHKSKILYLENQEKIRENQQLKASLYDAALVPPNGVTSTSPKGYGCILHQVVRKVEESISFLDSNMPLYKQDFQSIINKLYDWVAYFNRRERAKYHALIQPTKITFDKLIRKVEVALSQEVVDPPRLLVEKNKWSQ